jgi:hypothetical protein
VTDSLKTASTVAVDQALDVFLCAAPTQAAYSSRDQGLEDAGQADFQGIFAPPLRDHVGQ